MVWLLWHKPVAQQLTVRMKESLISEFTLNPLMVDKMRFSGKKGRYANRRVKYIRIYDPTIFASDESDSPGYDALGGASDNNGALLFEGRIDDNAETYWTDLRNPKALFPLA